MTKDQAVAHYGTQQKLAKALGILQGSVAGWGKYPPPLRQLQIEALTGGKLKAEPGCHPPPAPAVPTAETTEKAA